MLGPLVRYVSVNGTAQKAELRAELIGIASWGDGCGQIGNPGIFSKVDHVLGWIHDTIKNYTRADGASE